MTEPVIIGDCTLYCCDCLEILPTLGKVDAVITDPPYGIGFDYASYDDTADNLERLIPVLMEAVRGARRGVITPGNTNIHRYPAPNWMGAWTWDTTTACGFWGWSQWQPILLYGDDVAPGTASVNGVFKSDRIHFSGGAAKIDAGAGGGHTCPKPLTFVERLVARFTLGGEDVCDPFMGSGTTGVACAKLGRKFIGIELEPRYFEIACRRIEEAYRQPDMFIEPPKPAQQEAMDL
jgi:DNA modification methylase